MVGLLIITHGGIGTSLLDTAITMLGVCPLKTETLDIHTNSDPDSALNTARNMIQQLNDGSGVLVLTDMYGSTPSNIACKLMSEDQVAVVGGINLPMLVRVLNYPKMTLNELVQKALSGGKDGVLTCSFKHY
jgi:PTS system ascorbate-specific IIA component